MSDGIRLVLVVTLVVGLDYGLPAAVASYTAITFIMVSWLIVAVRKEIPFSLRVDSDLLRKQLGFGARSYIQTLAGHLLLRIDIYMVAYFLTPREASFYALALHFTELVLEFPHAVGIVLYPKLASSSTEEVHRLTAQTCRRMLLVTAPTAAALAIGGPLVIRLWYGEPYAPAGAPLPWAAAGVVTMSLYVILTRNFTSRGLQRVNIIAGLLALSLNVVLNLLLIPSHGIVGAAVATFVSYAAACLILIALFVSETGLSPFDVFLPKRADLVYFSAQMRHLVDRGRSLTARASR
jgi:O-antigen/teichoic acid export membrane protein